MSKLSEIIELAESGNDLGLVLRKCKVLAARLGSDPLEDWLKWESNGYPDGVDVPDYRLWPIAWLGTFAGPYNSMRRNVPLPPASFPPELRDLYLIYRCRQSITSAEKIIASSDDSFTVTAPDLAPVFGMTAMSGFNCVQVTGVFTTGNFIEVVNTVQNRVLDFLLALEKTDPDAGEMSTGKSNVEPARVTQIFHVEVMHGDINTMRDHYEAKQVGAQGPGSHAHDMTFHQVWNQVSAETDFCTLKTELAALSETMQKLATEPDHYSAIGNVMAAEKAVEAGDGPAAMKYLRSAGQWAKDVANQASAGALVTIFEKLMESGMT